MAKREWDYIFTHFLWTLAEFDPQHNFKICLRQVMDQVTHNCHNCTRSEALSPLCLLHFPVLSFFFHNESKNCPAFLNYLSLHFGKWIVNLLGKLFCCFSLNSVSLAAKEPCVWVLLNVVRAAHSDTAEWDSWNVNLHWAECRQLHGSKRHHICCQPVKQKKNPQFQSYP